MSQSEVAEQTARKITVKGRLRKPVVSSTIYLSDGLLVIRIDDDADPAFWLEVTVPADAGDIEVID